MNISKLQHEKLLAAINSAHSDARLARDVAERAQLRANEAETELKKARAQVEGLSKQWAEAGSRNAELYDRVRRREAALVQIGLRLAAYGDPVDTLMVTP